MTFDRTDRVFFDEAVTENGEIIIDFASRFRPEFVNRLLRITLKGNRISELYFISNDYGTAHWKDGVGITDSNGWEIEDDLDNISFLSRNYQQALLDGAVPKDFALDFIVPDVLENIIDPVVVQTVYDAVRGNGTETSPDWNEVIFRNELLAEKYLAFLADYKEIEREKNMETFQDKTQEYKPYDLPEKCVRIPVTKNKAPSYSDAEDEQDKSGMSFFSRIASNMGRVFQKPGSGKKEKNDTAEQLYRKAAEAANRIKKM